MSTVGSTAVLTRTVRAEWLRLRTVRATWWFLAAGVVAMLGIATIAGLEERSQSGGEAGNAWLAAVITTMPGQFAFYGLVLLAVTADYSSRGIVPTLQWTPRRMVLFVARTLVPVVAATAAAVLLALSATALVYALVPEFTMAWTWAEVDVLGTVALVVGSGCLLAVGLGFLFRSTAGGLVTVFLVMLVLPMILPQFGYDWLLELAQVLPGYAGVYLLFGEDMGITTTHAVVVLASWAVGALALGATRLAVADADG
jgi:ABC-2 type transport system permease protein